MSFININVVDVWRARFVVCEGLEGDRDVRVACFSPASSSVFLAIILTDLNREKECEHSDTMH
jgi:hypothetical protein